MSFINNGYEYILKYGHQGVLHEITLDRSKARTVFTGSRNLYKDGKLVEWNDNYVMELLCSSIYVCPFTNNCLRAGYLINKRNPEHAMLCEAVIRANEKTNWKGLEHDRHFYFIVDPRMELLSYSYMPSHGYRYSADNPNEDYKRYMLYESKAELIREIFESIQTFGSVSGLQFCNANVIPDDIVLSLGAIQVHDQLSAGPPLWMANLERIVNPEDLQNTWSQEVKDRLHKQASLLIDTFRSYLE
jgi:hypothetical protein